MNLLAEWSSSAEACGQYLSRENHTTEECYEKYCNHYFWNRESKTYLIELKTDERIGVIRYWSKPEDELAAMISVKIARPEFRKRGFGTEAQIILVKHLFDVCGFAKLEMYTDIDNIAQQKCLEKLGFDFGEIVTYPDVDVIRTGKRYHLTFTKYREHPIYRYYFETCRDNNR